MKHTQPIWALGAMSGTSLDGVDGAMLRTDGEVISEFGAVGFRPYSADDQAILRRALGQWPQGADVAAAQEVVETAHAALLSRFEGAELIGFHGQTLAHDPAGRGTHQTGDGALLADILQTPVVWDFRTADVELGGQGAPLAPFFHFACAKWIKAKGPIAFLNLGGVGNLTYVDPRKSHPEDEGALLAFDTGPANAPVNDLMMQRQGLPFDTNGDCAAQGRPDADIIKAFLTHPYFHKMPPKSLDRNDFPNLAALVADLPDNDAAATLIGCASAAIARGLEHAPEPPSAILVTGGGRKNAYLMQCLARDLSVEVKDIDQTGLNGDMLEAQAFAYLAVRVARGLPTSGPSTTGVAASVGGGRLSKPSKQ
ncbi:anhydro-N-acetylmuramic acid kinase [Litoreibacter sp.]|nr:anhydro-N-acetylmuramic acid kinase [Litoreibacter sp.]